MSRYLEEAAALLRKAAEAHERSCKTNTLMTTEQDIKRRESLARHFATLAAIDKGLLPAEMVQDAVRAFAGRNGGA
ncbi:hypothetical protein [Streptomyces sp. Ac-502]|uniref:hypothetical protein n=1 Tax=Streptomyces sp. Ac-502 TaxID=3342801 RepID=UPI003862A177